MRIKYSAHSVYWTARVYFRDGSGFSTLSGDMSRELWRNGGGAAVIRDVAAHQSDIGRRIIRQWW